MDKKFESAVSFFQTMKGLRPASNVKLKELQRMFELPDVQSVKDAWNESVKRKTSKTREHQKRMKDLWKTWETNWNKRVFFTVESPSIVKRTAKENKVWIPKPFDCNGKFKCLGWVIGGDRSMDKPSFTKMPESQYEGKYPDSKCDNELNILEKIFPFFKEYVPREPSGDVLEFNEFRHKVFLARIPNQRGKGYEYDVVCRKCGTHYKIYARVLI
ncbi:MAG: hypothetical protein ABIE55_02485 [Candidatus Aenigmatarchaeota archaeon]